VSGPRVVSLFEGNEAERTAELLADLVAGRRVTLISEAGTPSISDPGQRLVAAAAAAGVRVEVVPGPSAAIAALVGSGLPADRFLFVGFPPREEGARQELFGSLAHERATLIFFEAPARVGRTLADLGGALGAARPACVARELTKLHEELVRGPLGDLAARYRDEPPRGECTLVVAGATEAAPAIDVEAEVRRLLAEGGSPKDVAARLALATGKPRRALYQLALALRGR
jgi:16S rRNA (cytidine1402-2'-O)-methyltransferase